MYGVPVTCASGKYERVKGLAIDEFSRGKMDNTLKELSRSARASNTCSVERRAPRSRLRPLAQPPRDSRE